jgi:thermostable 8-oxoguanine DNA glycosylase
MDFPNRRPGYIQEYEEEIKDLRDMIDLDEKERISTRQFIEELVARVFGVSDISTYLNRKRDKDDNGDPKGGSNKHQGG